MKLYDKTERYQRGKTLEGKYKGCDCFISYNHDEDYWYFYCMNKEDTIRYNCLWDGFEYNSQGDCADACMVYVDLKLSEINK